VPRRSIAPVDGTRWAEAERLFAPRTRQSAKRRGSAPIGGGRESPL